MEALGRLDARITAPKTVGSDEYLESYIADRQLCEDEIEILTPCFDIS